MIKPHVAPTLDGTPWLDGLIRFDPKSRDREAPDRRPSGPRLRAERADLAVLLPELVPLGLAGLGGGHPPAGRLRPGRARAPADRPARRPPRRRRAPAAGRRPSTITWRSSATWAAAVDSVRTELATTADDEAAADRAWSALGLSARRAGRLPEHRRGVRPGQELAGRAFRDPGPAAGRRGRASACWSSAGRASATAAAAIVAGAGHPRSSAWPAIDLSIGLTKACVRRSALMITTDSGPRHFAAAFDVPVLTLFGPTHIAWTRTYHPHAVHLYRPGPVRPLPEAGLPAGAPPLHDRADARRRLPGGRRRCCRGGGPDPVQPPRLTRTVKGRHGCRSGSSRGARGSSGRHVLDGPRARPASRSWRWAGVARPAGRRGRFVAADLERPESVARAVAAVAARRGDPRGGPDAPGRARGASTGPTRWRRSTCSTPCGPRAAPSGSSWRARRRSSGRSTVEALPVGEDHPCRPADAYGAEQVAGDLRGPGGAAAAGGRRRPGLQPDRAGPAAEPGVRPVRRAAGRAAADGPHWSSATSTPAATSSTSATWPAP